MPQDPPGCVDQFIAWVAKSPPRQLIVTGRTDKRELTPAATRQYHNNASLAFQRAQAVIDRLDRAAGSNGRLKALSVPLTAGPQHLAESADSVLRRDRSVEIRAYWQRPSAAVQQPSRPNRIGWALNDEALDSAVSLTVLSLLVALSAYLAAVGLFMRERAANLGSLIDELDQKKIAAETLPRLLELLSKQRDELWKRKNRTETRRTLLGLLDFLMIVAALLIGLHLFYFLPPQFLRASVVLVTFSGFSLVLLHLTPGFSLVLRYLTQWWQTLFKHP